ncbi:MAG: PDZ domain-containing protein [Actinobacteria bacterium]|nr:PDZ domain-containing protein [Actinomycetota bacterium]
MARLFSPARAVVAGLVVLVGSAFVLWITPSNSYLLLPDEAKPLESRVRVEGEKPDGEGGIFFVDVVLRKASRLEEFFSPLRPAGSDIVAEEALIPPGTDLEDRRRQNLRQMDRSQEVAAAVALRELGYDIEAVPRGALIVAVASDAPAAGKLEPTEVIVAADGKPVRTPTDLRAVITNREPGESVELRVRAGGATRTVRVGTIESPSEDGRAVVGVHVEQAADIDLPIDVEIDLGRVGGPSAGLAFALDIVEELRGDVDGGLRVAATGELELDGGVVPVGGVRQKVLGARATDVDVFLVPAGDNAQTARRYAGDLRVIAVESFGQALRSLATATKNS